MKSSIERQLAAARAKVLELEKAHNDERFKILANLPASYGFDNVDDFIQALRSTNPSRQKASAKSAAPKTSSRGRRAKITDETKQEVKKSVQAGKTGAAIAKELGISLPSVQNIKRELGLVRKK